MTLTSKPEFLRAPHSSAETAGSIQFQPDQYRSFASLAEAFFFNANANPDLVAYDQAQLESDASHPRRRYVEVSQRESKERVLRVASALREWGVRPGEAVAIMSLNRPEWTEAEMAVYAVGAVAVPTYVRLSPERLAHVLQDSGAAYAVVENQQLLEAVLAAVDSADREDGRPALRYVLTFEETSLPPRYSRYADRVTSWPEVMTRTSLPDEQSLAWIDTGRGDLATIFYTSGSNGLPSGVPVTHGQALENMYQIAVSGLVDYSRYESGEVEAEQPFVTLLLPELAHAFPARTAQLVATSPARGRFPAIVDRKVSQINAAYRDSMRRDLREGGAGMIPVVPKILVTIEQRVREKLRQGNRFERLAGFVVANAEAYFLETAQGSLQPHTHRLYRWLTPLRQRIVKRIRSQVVGPDFGFFISGGAKLPLKTAAFLWAIGLPVHEGYGSTEANCPIATNTPLAWRLGSVGKVFADIEVRLDVGTSELWLRGPNIVSRYWNGSSERDRCWTDDHWYRTRDVARLDGDGFLYIHDRLDNILVLGNGENVSAVAIEERFASVSCLETVIVVGHQRPALIALLSLEEQEVFKWATQSGFSLRNDWRQDPQLLNFVRQGIEWHVNSRAEQPCERVRHFGLIPTPMTEDHTLTATEKIRRREIEHRYAALIEQLYQDRANWLSCDEANGKLRQ